MRSLAIDRLSTLTSPVDRVVLARTYGVDHWLLPAYQDICVREEWLSDEEGYRLGIDDVLKIGRARQDMRTILESPDTIIGQIFGSVEVPGSNTAPMLASEPGPSVSLPHPGDGCQADAPAVRLSAQGTDENTEVPASESDGHAGVTQSELPDLNVAQTTLPSISSSEGRAALKAAIAAVESAELKANGAALEAEPFIATLNEAKEKERSLGTRVSAHKKRYLTLRQERRRTAAQAAAPYLEQVENAKAEVEKAQAALSTVVASMMAPATTAISISSDNDL
jgi:hypothetical protein